MSEESDAINKLATEIGIAATNLTEVLLALQGVQERALGVARETRDELQDLGVFAAGLATCVDPGYIDLEGDVRREPSFRIRHFLPEASENG